jgi:hypothetical protein
MSKIIACIGIVLAQSSSLAKEYVSIVTTGIGADVGSSSGKNDIQRASNGT